MKTQHILVATLLAAATCALWPAAPTTDAKLAPRAHERRGTASEGGAAGLLRRHGEDESAGRWQRYALDFRAAATFDPGTERARTIDLAVRGRWKATRSGDDLYELRLEDAEVDLAGAGASAGASADALEDALETPHYLRLDEHGLITEFLAPPGTDPATWRIWFSIASFMQFQQGDGEQWTATELDPAGEYVAEYAHLGGNEYEKRKLQYLRVQADGGWVPQEELSLGIDGLLRVTRGDDELPARVIGSETSWTETETALVGISVKTEVSLTLSDSGHDAGAVERFEDIAADLVAGVAAPRSDSERARPARSFGDLLAELDAGETSASLLIDEMSRAMQSDPSATERAVELLRTQPERDPSHVLVAALSGAGTDAAQRALREIAGDEAISELVATEAIVELGRTPAPTEASVELLIESLDDPRPAYSSTAALALGNAADHLGDSERGREAVRKLAVRLEASSTPREIIDLLAALGNTASTDALPAITPHLTASNDEVRAAAADALKLIPSPEVPGLLATLLAGDQAAGVRGRAAYALGYFADRVAFEALAAALRGDDEVGVRGEALASVAKIAAGNPAAVELLQWVAHNDASAELREQAMALL